MKEKVLNYIKGGLIVSCQARKGWPMYGTDIMVAFAKAAQQGGAVGIRATEPENISAIKKEVNLPMIGIYKQWFDNYEVYITPTYESAESVIKAGADIVAIDGTNRRRPGEETLEDIIEKIHVNYPEIIVMADCDGVESAKYSEKCGADIVSTTLVGYTNRIGEKTGFNSGIISEIKKNVSVPVIAEGHISTPEELIEAYEKGAFSVVVGTAITRPEIITKKFVDSLEK